MAVNYTKVKPKVQVGKSAKDLMLDYDQWTKTRLSPNFLMRDFLYSSRGDILELSNRPSDDPDQVIKAGQALCMNVLEPLLEKFGRFAITYGYQSRELIEAGYPPAKKHSSAPHQWDRGTFGKDIYARVDIMPFAVEDGKVPKMAYAAWAMENLDIDLLMQWKKSNVFCITISPQPRRVWLEWTPKGQGSYGGNKIEYMGEDYWQNIWPTLPPEHKPKFGPSATNGKMYWSE